MLPYKPMEEEGAPEQVNFGGQGVVSPPVMVSPGPGLQAPNPVSHYNDVIMNTMVSQITGVSIVCSTVFKAQIKEHIEAPRHWPL